MVHGKKREMFASAVNCDSPCSERTLRYSDRMSRVLLLLPLIAGCAAPERYRAYDTSGLKTADERELELRTNLRDGVPWEEQERRIADAKVVFGVPSSSDATGPAKSIPK
jgi:hypothetical protein